MITRYEFKNFCSFEELSILELLAPSNKVKNRFPDNFVKTEYGLDILKTAVIVGENAGGKTNVIKSLNFLKKLFQTNNIVKSFKNLININNICSDKIKDCNTEQSFYLEVLLDKSLYIYSLKIDHIGIVEEKLSVKKTCNSKIKEILLAKRNILDDSNDKVAHLNYKLSLNISEEKYEPIANALEANELGLYINKLALVGNPSCSKFVDFIINDLYADEILYSYNILKDYKKDEDDQKIIKELRFLDILKMVDPSIIGLEINEEHPFMKSLIKRKKQNGDVFSMELDKDSSGVIKFFSLAVQIYRVVYENKIIFADEMDKVLNPILSDKIISFINAKSHKGQFIITTHNALHLDLKKYMKEQIYFATKNPDTLSSELYSLADFLQVRYETTKIHEFYMKGILGGITNA
ncbi:MAG: AAA family ATPase [Pleomorphochaeta sp.]